MIYYKILKAGYSCSGGQFNWRDYLPTDDSPGEWVPEIAPISVCERGYHGTIASNISMFLNGDQLYEVEVGDKILWHFQNGVKFVTNKMRLMKRIYTFNDTNLRKFSMHIVDEARRIYPNVVIADSWQACYDYVEKNNGNLDQDELRHLRQQIDTDMVHEYMPSLYRALVQTTGISCADLSIFVITLHNLSISYGKTFCNHIGVPYQLEEVFHGR